MSINTSNYEAFILDYLEGQLTADQKAALFSFLDAHPELAAEFDIDVEGLPLNELVADSEVFPELTAPEDQMPSLIDEKLAAALEGDIELPTISGNALAEKHWLAMQQTKLKDELVSSDSNEELKVEGSESQQTWLAAIAEGDVADGPLKAAALKDPKLANDIAWMKRSVVKPMHVSFGDLDALKREETKVIPLFANFVRYGAVAAAVVAILFWFGNMNNSTTSSFYQAYNPMLELTKSVMNPGNETQETPTYPAVERPAQVQFADHTAPSTKTKGHPTVQVDFARLIDAKGIANSIEEGQLQQESEANIASVPASSNQTQQVFASSTDQEFTTLKKLVVDRAKQKVSKDDEVKDDATLLKVVIDRLEGEIEERKKGRLQLVLPNKKKGRKLYFRLGKFEINKPSRVVELIHGT